MGTDIEQLMERRTWRAFDVDDAGRVLAGWDETGSVQLVELGQDGTVTRLTDLPGKCSGHYLPGERAVLVAHDDGGNERTQLSLLRLDPLPERPATLADLEPLVHDPNFIHSPIQVLPDRVVYLTNRRNRVDFDVVVREVSTGVERVLFARGGMVMDGTLSQDGERLAIRMPAVPPHSDQVLVVADGDVRELTDENQHAKNTHPNWLPDGSLVVTSNRGRDLTGIARHHEGEWSWLVTDDEFDLIGYPSPDGRLLLVLANDDGAARLALHDATTGARLRSVPLPEDGWVRYPLPEPVWSPDSRFAVLTFSGPTTPGDVLLVEADTGATRALTDSSAAFADALVTPSHHRVPTPDGELVPCLVYRPTSTVDGVAGSAVLVLHGGPESQSTLMFNAIVQGLVAAGHAVLVPNVRGSTGYGKRWYSADDVRRRLDAVADLAALHDWLPSLGLDPSRAALWGGSYGGYLVLAGLAFQPERWAAGVDIVGISSLVSFLENTSPYRRAIREREYGSLERDREFLHSASPLNRVDQIRAPLFVIHGANDSRVPLSEAEQVAEALHEHGVECELLVYGDEGHGLAKRTNRLDAYPKAAAFVARVLTR
ncbi:S9 family peptidase [Solihabitans fulvus]|uniref:S9 family peptidase n=1 Tax=Solihabitans fulvus TaxID=1892852 RepID=A0A5B2XGN6_9PSEU|nr:S9 family peptidase [Solihabitans fulvus]KAA2262205.1 S9 family peptidase [Solihabitans fulvus]